MHFERGSGGGEGEEWWGVDEERVHWHYYYKFLCRRLSLE